MSRGDTGNSPASDDPFRAVVLHLARRMRDDAATWNVCGFGTETYERMVRALVALGCTEEAAHVRLRCIDRAPEQAEEGTRVTFVVHLDPERVRDGITELLTYATADAFAAEDAVTVARALDNATMEGA